MRVKIIVLTVIIAVFLSLVLVSPVFSLGLSPVDITINVSADGETEQYFQVTNFNGSMEISLEDIPLQIEPNIVSIDASGTTKTIKLTIYGNESFGEQTFEGTINFLPINNNSVVVGIKVLTTVNQFVNVSQMVDRNADSGTPVQTYVGIGIGCALAVALVIAIMIRKRKIGSQM